MATKTTELQAINIILTGAGYQPVLSLTEADSIPEATEARTILSEMSKQVQTESWAHNWEEDVEVTLDGSGEYPIPEDTHRIKPHDTTNDWIQRQNKIYDRGEHTFVLGVPAATIKVDVVYSFDFEELPETLRRYILLTAQEIFLVRYHGEEQLLAMIRGQIVVALGVCKGDDIDTGNYNMLDSPDSGDIYFSRFNGYSTAGRYAHG